jgi:hypothetical protein
VNGRGVCMDCTGKTVGTSEQQPSGKLLYPTERTPFVEGGLGVSFERRVVADECAIRSIVSPGGAPQRLW